LVKEYVNTKSPLHNKIMCKGQHYPAKYKTLYAHNPAGKAIFIYRDIILHNSKTCNLEMKIGENRARLIPYTPE